VRERNKRAGRMSERPSGTQAGITYASTLPQGSE